MRMSYQQRSLFSHFGSFAITSVARIQTYSGDHRHKFDYFVSGGGLFWLGRIKRREKKGKGQMKKCFWFCYVS